MTALEGWIAAQYRHSTAAMLRSISCTVVMSRPGFAQQVTPAAGSIVASPVPGYYDPNPDYFFHWLRDSALVIDALRVLHLDPAVGLDARSRFADFVRFSQSLQRLDGRALVRTPAWRTRVTADFQRYLRADADLATAHGAALAGETRFNPDASLDISSWPRPQNDGVALRALSLMRWLRDARLDDSQTAQVHALLEQDLDWTQRCCRQPCFDIWEEEQGLHYYPLRMAAAALRQGAAWFGAKQGGTAARACLQQADAILRELDDYWLGDLGYYRSRVLDAPTRSLKELDISVILAAIHAGEESDAHTPHDPRMRATLDRLEALFDAAYPINRGRPAHRAPAMGRYPGDVYFSGGAYYFATLGAAEFYFKAAVRGGDRPALLGRGDAFLETVRAFTPDSGEMSEQFDQHDGAPRSAPQLAWSHAAFISCIAARRAVKPPSA